MDNLALCMARLGRTLAMEPIATPSNSRLRTIAFGLGTSCVAVLLCLVAVEVGMRILGGDRADTDILGPYFDRSPTIYYPATSRIHPWSAGHDDILRIAVIGDSITAGAGVQPDDTYGMRLERLLNLNQGVTPAEVHIFAGGGTATFTQKKFVTRALDLQPDIMVLGICMNDTEDWMEVDELFEMRKGLVPQPPAPWVAPLVRRSRVAAWIHAKREDQRINRDHIAYYHALHDPDYSGYRRFAAALKNYKKQCEADGVQFVAVLFPMLSWRLDEDHYPFLPIRKQTMDLLADLDIPALDLFPVYQGMSPDRLQVIPLIDGHPNEIGHRIAAEALFEFLIRQQYVSRHYMPKHRGYQSRKYWASMTERKLQPMDAPPATTPVP